MIRLLLLVGLVSGAASLAPLAAADGVGDPAASSSATPSSTVGDPDPTATSTATADPTATTSDPTATDSSTATDTATDSATASPTDTATPGSEPPTPTGSATGGPSSLAGAAATQVTFTHRPPNLGLTRRASFSYHSSVAGVHFQCKLTTGRETGRWSRCPSNDNGTGGTRTYRHLKGNASIYHFVVRAVTSGGRAGPAVSDPFRIWTVWSPGHYSPRGGASFNNPLGGKAARRTNLSRVVKTLNGMPGYREASPSTCPTKASLRPGTVRISLYSLVDQAVAKALVAASRRCISVQVLMNDHLNAANDRAWRRLERALGSHVKRADGAVRRSFAHRCHHACRGGGVLHLKMYLFDSTVPHPKARANRTRNTVMVGSSNMTSNAAGVQWNDLYTIRQPEVWGQYNGVFNMMRKDNGFHRYRHTLMADGGRYQTTFSPQPKGVDPWRRALRNIHCTGATGGSGINGHTVLYINIHAWFGARGNALANQVRRLYDQGCYVRVLYSFMGYRHVYKKLISGASSPRMIVRRTIFSHNGSTAYVYSHFKNLAVSGHLGGNSAARVVWTGSNNWTNYGLVFDEVIERISSVSAYHAYRNHWKFINRTKSSGVYANYSEPSGGGRVP